MGILTQKRAQKILAEQESIVKSIAASISKLRSDLETADAFGSWAMNSLLTGGEMTQDDLIVINTEFSRHAPDILALAARVGDMGSIIDADPAVFMTNLSSHITKYNIDLAAYEARFEV